MALSAAGRFAWLVGGVREDENSERPATLDAFQLDMDIVAEGIEEQEQVETVREAGCTLGQGYFFSRAVPDYLAAMLLAQDREDDGLRAA